jgi:hypothetical protein
MSAMIIQNLYGSNTRYANLFRPHLARGGISYSKVPTRGQQDVKNEADTAQLEFENPHVHVYNTHKHALLSLTAWVLILTRLTLSHRVPY